MGVTSGSITFRRYRALDPLPDGYRTDFLTALSLRAHQEIDPDGEDERSIGWVVCGDVLDTGFSPEKVFVGDTLLASLRVDSLKVPAAALSLYLKRAEREFLEATQKTKLTKVDKEEVKDRVKKALRKRILPSIKGYDVAWSLTTGVVRLWTHNATLSEEFQELFLTTFGIRLLPRTPYTAVGEVGLGEQGLERVLDLEPADLVGVAR